MTGGYEASAHPTPVLTAQASQKPWARIFEVELRAYEYPALQLTWRPPEQGSQKRRLKLNPERSIAPESIQKGP